MFDWNGNGKHDAFDDFVTFGLVHHIIEDSKKNEQSPAQNKGRTVYSHHVKDENKTDNRSKMLVDDFRNCYFNRRCCFYSLLY